MRKTIAILLVLGLCVGLCACSTDNDSSVMPRSSLPEFSIDDIIWNIEEGIRDGKRYILLSFTNNTKYAITEFEIEFREKEDISNEAKDSFYADMKELWEYSDEEMEQLKKMPISMWTRAENYYVAPGEKLNNITVKYYQGAWKVSNIDHYNLLEPDIATIKYVDGDFLYTAYYDFTSDKFYIDEDVVPAYYWTESALGDLIPKPESPVVEESSDRDTLFCIDAFDMTLEDFNNYAEQCKQLGFVVEARSHEGFYAANNADGYAVRLEHYAEWNMLRVWISSPDN